MHRPIKQMDLIMKEVAFRWIDKYLIHIKLQEKFYLLFFLPLLVLIILAAVLDNAADSILQDTMNNQVQIVAHVLDKYNVSQADAAQILRQTPDLMINSNNSDAISAHVTQGGYRISSAHDFSLWYALSTFQITLISIAVVLAGIAIYYIMTFIGGAMFTMNKALQALSTGDLTNRMNFFPVRDEFSTIAITIDKVSEREQKLVLAMQESVALMQQISSDLSQSAQQSSSISNTQQSHLDSLASATEQMASTIREVASHAHDASSQTNEATNAAESGKGKVNETVTSITTLSNEINSAAQAVEELDAIAAQIDDVVTTISSISEQTNLLALNAAIEAARAGEQGRGFAVVADEVRTLASRTQQATVEIQSMIEALQSNSKALTQLMSHTVNNATNGQQLMALVNDEIGNIALRNQNISDRSIEIAAAAEEQGAVADEIASSVEQVRSQSQEVHHMVQTSVQNIEQLRHQANELESLMSGLKAS